MVEINSGTSLSSQAIISYEVKLKFTFRAKIKNRELKLGNKEQIFAI